PQDIQTTRPSPRDLPCIQKQSPKAVKPWGIDIITTDISRSAFPPGYPRLLPSGYGWCTSFIVPVGLTTVVPALRRAISGQICQAHRRGTTVEHSQFVCRTLRQIDHSALHERTTV